MIKFTIAIAITLPFIAIADKNTFEINKHNCNMPMSTIRKLLPNHYDQTKALKDCMQKAVKEKWKQKDITQVPQQ